LGKAIGVPCRHLTTEHLCEIYPDRPPVCRDYRPDELCVALQHLPAEERVRYYLRVYDLEADLATEHPPFAPEETPQL